MLPDGPLNGSVCGTAMFRTNLDPTEEVFLSVGWNFSARHIITSLLSSNVTEPEYEGRITLFRATGSLELRDLESSDTGEYTLTIEHANGSQLVGRTRLEIHGEQVVKFLRK